MTTKIWLLAAKQLVKEIHTDPYAWLIGAGLVWVFTDLLFHPLAWAGLSFNPFTQ